jgi:transposase
MVEVQTTPGPAGIKLIDVTPKDQAQFSACIAEIEEYSQHLVRDFDSTTSQIQSRLSESGSIALRALTMLGESCGELDAIVNRTFPELESVIAEIEALSGEFEKIDSIQSELVLLSDLITAVEASVKHPQ